MVVDILFIMSMIGKKVSITNNTHYSMEFIPSILIALIRNNWPFVHTMYFFSIQQISHIYIGKMKIVFIYFLDKLMKKSY